MAPGLEADAVPTGWGPKGGSEADPSSSTVVNDFAGGDVGAGWTAGVDVCGLFAGEAGAMRIPGHRRRALRSC
jgi:hypothetical protein